VYEYRFQGACFADGNSMVDDDVRQLILQNANAKALADKAIEKGMTTLRMTGMERVKEGIASLEEMLSVTGGE